MVVDVVDSTTVVVVVVGAGITVVVVDVVVAGTVVVVVGGAVVVVVGRVVDVVVVVGVGTNVVVVVGATVVVVVGVGTTVVVGATVVVVVGTVVVVVGVGTALNEKLADPAPRLTPRPRWVCRPWGIRKLARPAHKPVTVICTGPGARGVKPSSATPSAPVVVFAQLYETCDAGDELSVFNKR